MKVTRISRLLVGAAIFALVAGAGVVQAESAAVSHKALTGTFIDFLKMRQALADGKPIAARSVTRSVPGVNGTEVLSAARVASFSGDDGLPLWTFNARSSRDGHTYAGAMVGSSPFNDPESTSVPANIIPVVLHVHTVATIDLSTFTLILAPGDYTANPSARDDVCLSAPNDVPATLLRQSPIFRPTKFVFGGTPVGTTQYIDAMQRANFYKANRDVPSRYHMLFAPVNELDPLVVDVPADEGVAIDVTSIGGCGTMVLVDVNWFDFELNSRWLPKLAREAGVGPGNLPIFMLYNSVLGGPPSVGLGDCCIGGYHSYGGFPTPTQTYSVADFDTTGIFAGNAFGNTAVIAHELGEWANDPFGINLVPAWGGTGQVPGCQDNLEVGDPLTGTLIGPITGSNGFPYLVQELAFFSWFLGAPSIGVNGWFSDNGTFLTDAGAACTIQ